ncbi:transmembrane protein 19-like [Scleropages formosus]|uniref:Transmembrane protein 19 n=1 Tax=Scleropages formosus TaxID=113540 RepID=A0A0P7UC32_SCLFO|nr:transmembrane protein 19-like [Scleropages formosus]
MQFEDEIPMKEYVKIVSDMVTFSAILAIALFFWIFSIAASAFFGLLVGFILMMANKSFFTSMLVFFITSYELTRWTKAEQRNEEVVEHNAGAQKMGWVQVLLNGGVPMELALLYIVEAGPRETALDFETQYSATWLCLSLLGAFACRTGDAWASRLGPVLSKAPPKLITSWREVPTGTNGGVTPEGLVASFAGGTAVGGAYFITQVLFVTGLQSQTPQWPVVVYGGMAGLMGSMLDSFLGAELQYSGYDESAGKVVNYESRTTKRICGKPVLDNNAVNLFSSIIVALLFPDIAWGLWPRD